MALHHFIAALLVGVVLAVVASGQKETYPGVTQTHELLLGDTKIGVVEWRPFESVDDLGLPLRFLNLHQNENCSVLAVKAMLLMEGRGSVLYFNKTLTKNGFATRNVTFTTSGVQYTFDPNRMFTTAGIATNIYPANPAVYPMVLAFGQQVLSLYTVGEQFQWVAIHNNAKSGSYSAQSYLPGQVYASDASRVHIGTYSTPKEFILVTDTPKGEAQYAALSAMGASVVLQTRAVPGSGLQDDGSLSYYAALNNQSYANVESTAPTPDDTEGYNMINQLGLFRHLVRVL